MRRGYGIDAGACVANLGVVAAFGGEELQRQFADYQTHVADIAR